MKLAANFIDMVKLLDGWPVGPLPEGSREPARLAPTYSHN